MPLDIDAAAEAAFSKLSAPSDEPVEDTADEVEAVTSDEPEDNDPGTAVDDGELEATDDTSDDEATDEATDEDAEVDEEDGEPQTDDSEIPEDAVELDAQATFVVEVDGKPVALTGDELRNGYLRHDDYTRKRQADAAARKEAEGRATELESKVEDADQLQQQVQQINDWYEERAAAPPQWIAEIAGEASQGDPRVASALLAQSIMILNDSNLLTEDMRTALQLDAPDGPTTEAAREGELEELRRRLDEREQKETDEEQRSEEYQELVAEYVRTWEAIKESEDMSFDTPEAEQRARAELVAFATEHDEVDLEKAWLKMQRVRARDVTTAAKDKINDGDGAGGKDAGGKRPSAAVNRSSTPQSRVPQPPAKDIDEAADRAYKRLVSARAG